MTLKAGQIAELYADAKRQVTARVVMRLARGNVSAQNGKSTSFEKFQDKSRQADESIEVVRKAVEAVE